MNARFTLLLLIFPGICAADGRVLFASDTPLDLVFEFPTREIIANADDRPVVEGSVHYTDESGTAVRVGLTMTTRGKSRLEYCQFPPLSANFKGQDKDGTLFDGQKKIKIVTQCGSSDLYKRYLLQEFGIYRAFNALTDKSFRVRMINVTYRDSLGKKKDIVESAFFLESDKELADRLGMKKHDVSIINPEQLDSEHASLLALFGTADVAGQAGAAPRGMQRVAIVDPSGFEKPMPAHWVQIPAGWRTQGGVLWCTTSRPGWVAWSPKELRIW